MHALPPVPAMVSPMEVNTNSAIAVDKNAVLIALGPRQLRVSIFSRNNSSRRRSTRASLRRRLRRVSRRRRTRRASLRRRSTRASLRRKLRGCF